MSGSKVQTSIGLYKIQYKDRLEKDDLFKMTSKFSTDLLVQQKHFRQYFRCGPPLKKSYWLLLKVENHLKAYKIFSKGRLEVIGGPS